MEALLVLVVLWVVAMPVVALVLALQARERARRSEAVAAALAGRVAALEGSLVADSAAPTPSPDRVAETLPPQAATVAVASAAPAATEAAVAPTAAESAGSAVVPPAVPRAASLEERIGVTWFTRIGAGVLILGALYFFKYAVDNAWIGPWGRVALGALAGIAVLIFAERQAPHARPVYVQVLVGVGLALLYVSAYATYGFYRLAPMAVAFIALASIAVLGGALAMRHRAQAVLVVALLAALANPMLLSTGDDLAAALFAYLALVSAATLLVSLRMRFAAAPWLAIAGVAGLWLSWLAVHFKVQPAAVDVVTGGTISGSAGAYLPLERRILPLVFVVALAAVFVSFARRARSLEWRSVAPVGMLLAAIVLGQWGCAALLVDRPPLIAAALAAWAVAAVLTLRDVAASEALAVPLVASFLFLIGRAGEKDAAAGATVLLVGAWLAAYAVSLVARARRAVTPAPWAVLALALALGAALAAALPAEGSAWLVAVSLAALAAAAGILGARGAPAWVGAPAAVVGLLALLAAPSRGAAPDGAFLAIVAVWGGVYLVSGFHQIVVGGAAADLVPTVLAAGGPAGFVAVALMATCPADAGLRALCAGGAGVALFAFGVMLLRRRAEARAAATALLGAALGLLTLAVGLAFSGVTVTLVWALLAATISYLAARAHDGRWLAGAAALFVVVLVRLAVVDLAGPSRDFAAFLISQGVEGRLAPAPFFNARALALLGVAVAFGTAAAVLVRLRREAVWRRAAGVAAVTAHLLLAGMLVSEVRRAVTSRPPPTAGKLSEDELTAVIERHIGAVAAQSNRRAVSATLALGAYGAVLLGLGFARRSVLHRWLGLAMLAATLAKLVAWDIWNVPRLYQVLVLISVGALLLGAGFLYARFGRRLLDLLKTGAVVLAAFGVGRTAVALDVGRHARRAAIDVAAAGLVEVPVPAGLYRASRAAGDLDDVRVAGPDGAEAPWVLRDEPAAEPVRELEATLLDPVVSADGSARAVLDLGGGDRRHNLVQLQLDGDEFLRHCRVETSDDRSAWGTIADGIVYRTRAGALPSEQTAVAYPISGARYLRVTVAGVPGEDPVRISGGGARLVPPAGAQPVELVPLAMVRREEDARERRTVLILDAGGEGLPLSAVLVDAPALRFERRVAVSATRRDELWHPVGGGVLFRAGSAENQRLPAPTSHRYIRLAIENGDDAPLEITAVRGEHRRHQLVISAAVAGRYTLYVGRADLAAPSYDLAAVLARDDAPAIAAAVLQPLEANPERATEVPAAPGPWSERHRVAIGIALAALLAALTAWALRSVRSE